MPEQTKHTPAPWSWNGTSYRTLVGPDGVAILWYTNEDDGVHCEEPDARLIAVAPELLEAVLAWDRFAAECAQRKVIVPAWAAALNEKAINLTVTAIAKVEGRES
jgi:hypothetical protein